MLCKLFKICTTTFMKSGPGQFFFCLFKCWQSAWLHSFTLAISICTPDHGNLNIDFFITECTFVEQGQAQTWYKSSSASYECQNGPNANGTNFLFDCFYVGQLDFCSLFNVIESNNQDAIVGLCPEAMIFVFSIPAGRYERYPSTFVLFSRGRLKQYYSSL